MQSSQTLGPGGVLFDTLLTRRPRAHYAPADTLARGVSLGLAFVPDWLINVAALGWRVIA